MKWGSFGVVHIASLLLGALIVLGLYFGLRNASKKVQTAVLGVLSFAGIGAIIYNLVAWGSPIEYLPLHLCSINAILLPIVVFTKNKTVGNMLLVWCLGALAALIVNTAQADFELNSWTFVFYYFPHVLEFGIPILLFALGMIEKHPKYILSTLAITMLIYTGVHFCNLGLNAYLAANNIRNPAGELIQVNYMYSIVPANPLLVLFKQVIPYDYWYMYMIVPILAVYLSIVYLPQILRSKKKQKV
ncbi:MAG: hypothetical protein E7453_07485 [Ruminococcaceae bacterium]|nr:hypothetical protein [Oscillospiraceae bacterium]